MSSAVSDVYQSMAVGRDVLAPLDPDPFTFGVSAYPDAQDNSQERDQLIATAASLRELLAENAAITDRDRRVPDNVIAALADAGLFKLTIPKRYGGHEADVRTIIDVAATLAEGCGSTAWVVTLINTVGIAVGMLSEQAQDEVFGTNPDVRVAGVFAPRGESRRETGGFQVTGTWFYGSGSLHSDWVMVGFPLVDEAGATVDFGLGLIPRADYRIKDTWHVVGMRGSGSNAIVVDDVFIPDHRILSVGGAINGQFPTEFDEETLYRSAFHPAFTLVLTGAQLGMGRATLKHVVDVADNRTIANTIYTKQRDSVAFQLQVADAAALIDTAHLHVYRAARDIDQAARRGENPGYQLRARLRSDAARAATCIKDALDLLITAHGAGSFSETSTVQRMWRDSNIALRHGTLVPMATREIYGKALLGYSLDENITKLL